MEILKARLENVREIVLLNDAVQKMHAEHHPEVFKYPTDAAERRDSSVKLSLVMITSFFSPRFPIGLLAMFGGQFSGNLRMYSSMAKK